MVELNHEFSGLVSTRSKALLSLESFEQMIDEMNQLLGSVVGCYYLGVFRMLGLLRFADNIEPCPN